jgi:hypothetical protein
MTKDHTTSGESHLSLRQAQNLLLNFEMSLFPGRLRPIALSLDGLHFVSK